MGYSTEFRGQFDLDKPLTETQRAYLKAFSETRRMKRDAIKTAARPNQLRESVKLPVGDEGGYFTGEGGFRGQNRGSDVIDSNAPPAGQPSLFCDWCPDEAGNAIICGEDSYNFSGYVLWLKYLIEHFLSPWGYVLNGKVIWQGDEMDDRGRITVENNVVSTQVLE